MFRVVIDPGVLIAALISSTGAPRSLLRAWTDGAFELLLSPALLTELERVLERDKFRRYVSIPDSRAYVSLLRRFGTVVPDVKPTLRLTADPGDDYLLALAIAQRADYLISGDPHLTTVKTPQVPVLTPRSFLTLL